MRVTNSMLISNSIYNIGNNTKRLEKAQQQQSTQSKIELPSDDPEVATQAVKYRNYVSTVEQYKKNVNDATSWMKVTEGALSDLHDVVQQVRDLTVQASNTGTLSESNLTDIKQEVAQLQKTVIQTLNTSYAGRYVFAGYDTDTQPYGTTTVTAGTSTVDKVTFKGKIVDLNGAVASDVDSTAYAAAYASKVSSGSVYQDSGVDQSMKYNIGFGNQITVNVEGQDVVGTDSGSNLFATFDKLLIGLSGGTSYQSIAGGTATGSAALSSGGYTVTAGTNDTLNLAVDGGTATTITIPAGTYSSASAFMAAVNKGISASSLAGKVTASLNSSSNLVFTTTATTTSSTVAVSEGNGAMAAYVGTAATAAGGTSQTTSFTLSDVLGDLDTDLDRISAVTSNLGAREKTATIAANRLSDENTVYTKLMSTNEDVDTAESTTNVSTAETVYEASLSAAAKAISKTLLDYIS
ncbi:MAG: flagellar hook-associated protein FlgL [Veillonellales bacterium]